MMYKRFLTIFVLLIIATGAIAQRHRPYGGTLNIYSADVPFFLYINNVLYNNRASRDIRVPNMRNPHYNLRIVFADRQRRTLQGSGVQLVNRNGQYMHVVFSVSNQRGAKGIILESMNPIDQYHDGYRDEYDQEQPNSDPYGPTDNDETYREYDQDNVTYDQREQNDHTIANYPGKNDSNRLNDLLNQKENDQDRLLIASQELKSMQLNASEIVDLMELFIRDDNKLAFAQYAYPTCVDKQNYGKVSDALSFSSTREKLAEFIRKNGQ
ncbi:DUF4476 domain-containing protein [Sphingobacterium sp. N143]|uniref:DUF4476 domain-containing protein n=1 Tax=Sphingobacterium sp. N143 TaxID=2746727 RepID=UPI002574AD0F|nr:DUF4476 domain-containing protein [Sphingobacterium sp. N143]MDM1294761.1 DUF4476 domain-containing protein [Sphingobacterium sp. N143]